MSYTTMEHTCYVEVWPHYHRIFNRKPTPVEVCNDGGAVARMFQLLHKSPSKLLTAYTTKTQPEGLTCEKLLQAWSAHQQMPPFVAPESIEQLKHTLFAPYQRLKTVLFEALSWRDCLERYNDPRALLILEPVWSPDERDEWSALQLRLARARFQWKLFLPHQVLNHRSFPNTHRVQHSDTAVCLVSHTSPKCEAQQSK